MSKFTSVIRTCIDGRMLDDGGAGTGVGQYARTVINALHTLGVSPLILEDGGLGLRRNRFAKLLAATRVWHRRAVASERGFVVRDVFREAQVFFDIYNRPMPISVPGPPGIMHWSYPLPLRLLGWRNLYTVHDVLPLDPKIPSPVNGPRLRRMLDALRVAGGEFVTVSEAAQRQIVERLGWLEDSVVCCQQGVDVTGLDRDDLPGGLQHGMYLLFVGSIEARKNLKRLLEAYRGSGLAIPLVLSGPDGLDAVSIDRSIEATPGAIRLRLQTRATTLQLIAHARALILVSLDEGFGLPVAEAMALGTPVLASDVTALAEVSGGAAMMVDPTDVAAIRDALVRIDGDTVLRNRLSKLGMARARHFTLEPYARRLSKLYGMTAHEFALPSSQIG